MPEVLVHYWSGWNEGELDAVPGHMGRAVAVDVEWNDPRDSFIGLDSLVAAVHRLRTSKPEYYFVITSEVDHHHGRFRYRWNMMRRSRVFMEGLDVVTVDPGSGLINRVDGFFGSVTDVLSEASGVPEELRRIRS